MARAGALGPSVGLNRVRVLSAAIDLIDGDGLGALTMRRLGEVLGVEGMAIYHYIAGREELLDGVVEVVTADVAAVTLPEHSRDWRTYLRSLADGFTEVTTAHPGVFALLLTHPAGGEWWLRPPMRDPSWHTKFVATLLRCGFNAAGCSTTYRWFTSFLTGQLLPQATSVTTDPLIENPQAALRRSAEYQADFESSFASLIDRLAPLARPIPAQRCRSSLSAPPSE